MSKVVVVVVFATVGNVLGNTAASVPGDRASVRYATGSLWKPVAAAALLPLPPHSPVKTPPWLADTTATRFVLFWKRREFATPCDGLLLKLFYFWAT